MGTHGSTKHQSQSSTSMRPESDYAEVAVDRLLMESFANEASAYFKDSGDVIRDTLFDRFRNKLKWHIARSLSPRQKQVIMMSLKGKKQREIAKTLGITQQVVSIYKSRAINKLRKLVRS
jgi:RNA polymerase sigma factor (sigma-70 family)